MRLAYLQDAGGKMEIHLGSRALVAATATVGLSAIVAGAIIQFWVVDLPRAWVLERPKVVQEMELNRKAAQLDRLQRALELDTPTDRATSLRLLVDLGLLDDPSGAVRRMSASPAMIPHWKPRPTSLDPSRAQ
jgi:hypothetical protein